MINTNNVVYLLSNLVSKRLTSVNTFSSPIKPREVEYWRDHVLAPSLSKHSEYLLLSDSWSTQGAKSLYESFKNLERLAIPPKTTSLIQTLDVYFNRQWKAIARKTYDRVRLDKLNNNSMSERNNIIRLQSLIQNQMSTLYLFL
jgi:hypothetical protein